MHPTTRKAVVPYHHTKMPASTLLLTQSITKFNTLPTKQNKMETISPIETVNK